MKRSLSMALVFAVVLSMAAVGAPAALAEEEAPPEPTVVNFWSMWNANEPQAAVIQDAADAYEAATGVHVNIAWQGREVSQYLASSLEYGEAVDIIEDDYDRISSSYAPFLYDLTDMAEAAGYADHSYSLYREQVVGRDGRLDSIVEAPVIGGILYDREAFKEAGIDTAPATWEEFMDACAKLKKAGYGPLALDREKTHYPFYYALVRAVGEDALTTLRDNGGWAGNEAVVNAVQSLIDLVKSGYLVYGAPDTYPASQIKLGYGLAAMIADVNSTAAEIEAMTGAEVDWGVMPFPAMPGGADTDTTYVSATSLAVTAYSSHPQEAFDFILYLVTGKYDGEMAQACDQVPADPANEAPASMASAAEMMQSAAVPMEKYGQICAHPAWMTINDMTVQLFQGAYESGADFCAALDALYPSPEPEA